MPNTVFFSWQSDLPETRNVVRTALDRAVRRLNRAVELEDALRVDEDTAGIAGWPDINSTILDKIKRCEIFVADITPINGPDSNHRLTPNPNVVFELGYALATGLGRTRIICVVNTSYLPRGDLKELPFDLRGSRPLTFSLEDPMIRGFSKGHKDPVRIKTRRHLAETLEHSLSETFAAISADLSAAILDVTPHLRTDNLERFQVALAVTTPVPFQVQYLITEPSGTILSSIMMGPERVDPKDNRLILFRVATLKPLAPDNDVYVLSGKVAHIPSDESPVPLFYEFEVHYRARGNRLHEFRRHLAPAH